MVFKKKLNPKKGEINNIEQKVLQYLIENLPLEYGSKIKMQLKHLILINRVTYKSSMTTELFPEQYGSIPESLLFERKEEFRLATMQYNVGEGKFSSEIYMVSGRLFDIKIRPIPPKRINPDAKFELIQIKLEPNLATNVYESKARN